MDYSDMPTAKITKVQNRNFRCVVRGCSRHPSNWGNMRQHVNKDHLDELRKGTQHVDEQAMTDSNSTFCPICRRLCAMNSSTEPRAHNGCLTQQRPPSEDEGLEQGVVEGAQDQGDNEQQTQSFAEWMQATSSKLKDFLAAGLRRDTVAQQMEMRDFIMQGPKRKVMEQSEIVTDPADAEEFNRLLEEAQAVAAEKAAQPQDVENAEKANVERILRIVKHLEKGEISEARRAITQKTGLREPTMIGLQQLKRTYFPQHGQRQQHFTQPPPSFPLCRRSNSAYKKCEHTCSHGKLARRTHGAGTLGGCLLSSTRTKPTPGLFWTFSA